MLQSCYGTTSGPRIRTLFPGVENPHLTPYTLSHILVHSLHTADPKGRNTVTGGCTTSREVHEGTPIVVAPDPGSVYPDGIQTAEKDLGWVGLMHAI